MKQSMQQSQGMRRIVRPRRGATLVLVAVVSIVLISLAAFAIDMSRLYTGVNELQTASDAAALRGAQFLQENPATSPVAVTQEFAAANNTALNRSVMLGGDDVLPGFWAPGFPQPQILDPLQWDSANAVVVRAAQPAGLLFGRLLSATGVTPRQTATAWVANIVQVECPSPWGLPMIALNEKLYGSPSPDYTVRPTLLQDLKERLDEPFGRQSLTMIFWPPTHLATDGPKVPKSIGTDSAFLALARTPDEYADQLAAPRETCFNRSFAIDSGETAGSFPGTGQGSIQMKTVDGVDGIRTADKDLPGLCQKPPANLDIADCWPVGTQSFAGLTPGVTVTVAWVGAFGNGSVPVLTLGGFRVMCVYRSDPAGKSGKKQTCEWLDGEENAKYFTTAPWNVSTPYDMGTIVGYPVPLSDKLAPGTVLGNKTSLGQRLILVH